MYGLDNASGVNVMPKLAPVSSATPLWFTEGGAGLAASYPGQDWFNMIQAELLGILTAGGVKPEKGKLNQLSEAIKKIVNSADFQPSGSYATTSDLTTGLGLKLDKTSVVQVTGASTIQVMSQDSVTKALATKFNITGGDIAGRVDVGSVVTASQITARTPNSSTLQLNPIDTGPRIEHRTNGGTWYTHTLQKATGTIMHLEDPGTIPIGASILWNSSIPIPSGFWANEGRAFSATEYPELAKHFPTLRMPDDRGYAIRMADNGKNIDPGRTVGTYQEDALQNIKGEASFNSTYGLTTAVGDLKGAFYITGSSKSALSGGGTGNTRDLGFDASLVARTADETRMKNVAKILITRVK